MAPRDLITLRLDRETPDTLRSAVAAIAGLKTTNPKHTASILQMRDDFLQELRLVLDEEAQGALF
jgi:hypothetical protein